MAYDVARARVVLYGGWQSGGTVLTDTWEWNGSNWTEKTSAAAPPPRYRHAMAYDGIRQRIVLFGGEGGVSQDSLGDTWEWNGSAWSVRTPIASPTARSGHSMAYDEARNRVTLFGGGLSADTWRYLP